MKALFSIISFLICLCTSAQTNSKHVYVRPYTRSDGTYVPGHYRTAPNSTNRDNFSTKPNVNPYTGKSGYIEPDNNSLYSSPSTSTNYSNSYTSDISLPSASLNSSYNSSDIPGLTYDLLGFDNSSLYNSKHSYITKGTANLREHMSTTSAIKTTIPKGSTVKVISSFFGEWWEVYYAGRTGYVRSSLLEFLSSGYETNYSLNSGLYGFDNASLYNSKPTYYAKNNINLREHMSTQSAVITTIPKGSSVKVISSFFGEWWEIYYGGKTGYVWSSLLYR